MDDQKPYQWQRMTPEQERERVELYQRMTRARDVRDQHHDEFDSMTVLESVEFNAKTANSYIPPRANAGDINIVTGMPREKMLDMLSNIHKLNLEPTVHAFNKQDQEDEETGRVFTYCLKKSNRLDDDEVKRMLREYYMMEQGTVLIEEAWVPRKKPYNVLKKKGDPINGFRDMEYVKKYITTYHAERRIIDLTNAYPENIKEFDMAKQPGFFTREVMHKKEWEAIYGDWEAAQYVHPGNHQSFLGEDGSDSVPYRDFRLYDLEDDQIEVIKWQSTYDDHYQIICNGVFMLPPDFPLPWEWMSEEGDGKCYSVTKQVFEPISPFFFYGKSLMAKLRVHAEVLDEMLKVMLHKTKQSSKPPMGNLTGQTLSPRIFDAGTLWEGVDPRKLLRLIDHDGVTSSEFQMYELIRRGVSELSVSETFQGQATQGGTTATEIMEMQKQAQLALGLTMFACRRLEEKVNYLRLQNLLENWTRPIDERIVMVKDQLVKQPIYRKFSLDNVNLQNRMGTAYVEFTSYVPKNAAEAKKLSYKSLEKKYKTKTEHILVSVPLLSEFRHRWYVTVSPSRQESDDLNKVLFTEELGQIMQFFGPEAVNVDFYKRRFATLWGHKMEDVFTPTSMTSLQQMVGTKQNGISPPSGATRAGQAMKGAAGEPSLNALVGAQ